jgi:[protein-PII] uridylyltransferase
MPRSKSVLVQAFVPEPETVGSSSNGLSWEQRREWLRTGVGQRELAINADEVEVHFSAIPAHYWEHVTEDELIWGLETVHGFLKLVASPEVPATAPFVSWRQVGRSGQVRVMLCTWDRHGLLAKAAASFSAVRLNIVQAEVFTRSDNVVLDTFTITGADGHSPVSPSQMEQMGFLLEGALSEPPRFASVWACSRHKYLAPASQIAAQIRCENETSADSTLIHIEAADRLGLLYDILQAIADAGLNTVHDMRQNGKGVSVSA